MGLNFKELVPKKEISFTELAHKTLAVDSFNLLYQFLTTIRNPDGSPFTDRQGQVTSHLIGLFNRTTKLMENNIKLIFVFDGQPPEIKKKTWEKRAEIKKQAALKLKAAEEAGNLEEMYKFASRTASLTPEMVEEAKKLIHALGCPIIQAPSEGEAQCAHLVKKGHAYAAVSQDYDSLIFGCPLLVRNLSIEGRRKKAGRFAYQTVKPEIISLAETLNSLRLDLDRLILLALLVGTDYNPGGIKGIGPKTALKLLHEFPANPPALFQKVNWSESFPDLDWKDLFNTFKKIPTTDDYSLEWLPPSEKKLFDFLVKEHDFAEERVKSKLQKLLKEKEKHQQTGLGNFF